jgi:hypothetical protein
MDLMPVQQKNVLPCFKAFSNFLHFLLNFFRPKSFVGLFTFFSLGIFQNFICIYRPTWTFHFLLGIVKYSKILALKQLKYSNVPSSLNCMENNRCGSLFYGGGQSYENELQRQLCKIVQRNK